MRGACVVVVSTAAVALGVGMAAAQPAPASGPGGALGKEARFLRLTEDQVAQVEQALDQQRPRMQALHEKMRQNHEQLRAALDAAAPDAQAVGELVIEGSRLEKQARALRDEAEQTLDAVLTPEQKRRHEMLEAARAAMGRSGGPRGGPGMGPAGPGPEPR
jgi:Spy/CpxP family protein refolding chaperone